MEPAPNVRADSTPSMLARCPWCCLEGVPLDQLPECGVCDGGRYAPICGTLAPTKSYTHGRPFRFNPGTGELNVTRAKRFETYRITEVPADRFPGEPELRGFAFEKVSSGEIHFVLCSATECLQCDCGAASWGVSAKVNRIAAELGDPTYQTAGCLHADFILLAIREGMLTARDLAAASDK